MRNIKFYANNPIHVPYRFVAAVPCSKIILDPLLMRYPKPADDCDIPKVNGLNKVSPVSIPVDGIVALLKTTTINFASLNTYLNAPVVSCSLLYAKDDILKEKRNRNL